MKVTTRLQTMKRKTGVIVNNARFGFGKEYIILDKNSSEMLSPWVYNTVKGARQEAKRKKIKISEEW